MITFYCPRCWSTIGEDAPRCPHCGIEIARWLQEHDYTAKLIAALRHPEPTTPVRAAEILGLLGTQLAVPALLALAESDADIYQRAAAITALGRIGDPRAESALLRIASDGPAVLRGPAQAALSRLRVRSPAGLPPADDPDDGRE
jgi:HEAT repeat protein